MALKFSNSNSDREYHNIYGMKFIEIYGFIYEKSMDFHENSNSDEGIPRDD